MKATNTIQNQPSVVCPHCKKTFPVSEIKGAWLHRVCPACRKELSTAAFDNRVRDMFKLLSGYKAQKQHEKDLATRHAAIANLVTHPLLRPLVFVLSKNAERHQAALSRKQKKIGSVYREIAALASARYYTSEWHLCSGQMLAHGGTDDERYKFRAEYDNQQQFRLTQTDGKQAAGGFFGEWMVFETILSLITKGRPLEKARLIPNVYLPATGSPIEGEADQTDLVILTEQAAFVCEVKNWRSQIMVRKDKGELFITTLKDADARYEDDPTKATRQIKQRMADIAALGLYPKSRVYGIVVFVDPQSYQTTVGGFLEQTIAATCCSDGSGTLASIIEEKVQHKSSIVGQQDVDKLAEEMLAWVDRTGEIAKHQRKLADEYYMAKRGEELSLLADLAYDRRQAGYQKRREHGRKRDEKRSELNIRKQKHSKRARSTTSHKHSVYHCDDWEEFEV